MLHWPCCVQVSHSNTDAQAPARMLARLEKKVMSKNQKIKAIWLVRNNEVLYNQCTVQSLQANVKNTCLIKDSIHGNIIHTPYLHAYSMHTVQYSAL